MPKGAYIHIPFCEHICSYCDFNKYLMDGQPVWAYLKALKKEMATTVERFPSERIDTIYVGGGTPTALNEEQTVYFLESVRECLMPYVREAEFTMEANPGHLEPGKLAVMKDAGVNRLSLGVQALDDRLLAAIGRTHTSDDVLRTIRLAKDAGFTNISIDLMYRLPEQTLEALKRTLEKVLLLQVQHISIYALQVEPRTIFYNRMRKGTLPLPSEDEEADMYEYLTDFLGENGYEPYEISNFARPGYESRHNQIYWDNDDYYGFGAGAHSYVDGVRRVNAGWTKKYIRLISETGEAYSEAHVVSEQERMEEEMFLGLRKKAGVSKARFESRFGKRMEEVFGQAIERLTERKLLREDGDRIFLTEQGTSLGNEVFQEFIEV